MMIRRAFLLSAFLVACDDDENTEVMVDAGIDAAVDAGALDGGSCGFDQTYRVDWAGSHLRPHNWVVFRAPREQALELRASDGGVGETCSIALPCGGPGVDAQDIAQRLSDPEVVALFASGNAKLGSFGAQFASDWAPRIIQREDGKEIMLGNCTEKGCTDFPAALRDLPTLFDDLQSQHGTSWISCDGWPAR